MSNTVMTVNVEGFLGDRQQLSQLNDALSTVGWAADGWVVAGEPWTVKCCGPIEAAGFAVEALQRFLKVRPRTVLHLDAAALDAAIDLRIRHPDNVAAVVRQMNRHTLVRNASA